MYSENNPVEQELIDQLNSAQSKLSAIAQEPLVFFSSYRFQITLNGRRHRRHYPDTVREGQIRFNPIWDRYDTDSG